MTKTVLVPLAEGFEEIEAATIVDVLRRADLGVVTAALGDRDVRGAHDIVFRADTTLDQIRSEGERFDAVVLPGGMPGASNLRDDRRVSDAVRTTHAEGGLVAAICAAPIALEASGVLKGRRATAYPGFGDQLQSAAETCDDRVVEDGPVVTSAGPGTALEFALVLVARLTSDEMAQTLREGMLVR